MAKFPLRVLGLLLLSTAISVSSFQALFHATALPKVHGAIERIGD